MTTVCKRHCARQISRLEPGCSAAPHAGRHDSRGRLHVGRSTPQRRRSRQRDARWSLVPERGQRPAVERQRYRFPEPPIGEGRAARIEGEVEGQRAWERPIREALPAAAEATRDDSARRKRSVEVLDRVPAAALHAGHRLRRVDALAEADRVEPLRARASVVRVACEDRVFPVEDGCGSAERVRACARRHVVSSTPPDRRGVSERHRAEVGKREPLEEVRRGSGERERDPVSPDADARDVRLSARRETPALRRDRRGRRSPAYPSLASARGLARSSSGTSRRREVRSTAARSGTSSGGRRCTCAGRPRRSASPPRPQGRAAAHAAAARPA